MKFCFLELSWAGVICSRPVMVSCSFAFRYCSEGSNDNWHISDHFLPENPKFCLQVWTFCHYFVFNSAVSWDGNSDNSNFIFFFTLSTTVIFGVFCSRFYDLNSQRIFVWSPLFCRIYDPMSFGVKVIGIVCKDSHVPRLQFCHDVLYSQFGQSCYRYCHWPSGWLFHLSLYKVNIYCWHWSSEALLWNCLLQVPILCAGRMWPSVSFFRCPFWSHFLVFI